MKVLVVIPAYNEAENIKRVTDQIKNEYSEYDYIVINDGSTDSTYDICRDNDINVLNMPINLGLSSAIQIGLNYAYLHNYDLAVQFDGDGQHDPAYISELYKAVSEGYDIAIGSRFLTKKKPNSLRMVGSKILTASIKAVTGQLITDPTSGNRMFTRKVMKFYIDNINLDPEPDTMAYLIRWGFRIKEVQVEMRERIAGQSMFRGLGSAAWYMTRMFVSIVFIHWFRKRDSKK